MIDPETEERLQLVFAMYDFNGDGDISPPEFHAIVSASSFDADRSSQAELRAFADALFAEADVNGDGGIDLDEFRELVRRHPEILDAI